MERTAFLLLLLTGVLSQSAPHKYYLILQGKSWSDARTYCRTHHTNLATIRSSDDLVKLQAEAQNKQYTYNAWIGLYVDVNAWFWSLGNESLGVFTQWATSVNEPNNIDAYEECVTVTSVGWYDVPCTQLRPFVCFDGSRTGAARYILYNTVVTWLDAQIYCRQHHTDLASTRDSVEYSAVRGLGGYPDPWIGLSRDSWKWVDNSASGVSWWYPGQPDGGSESCACLNTRRQIADWTCNNAVPFFCYRPITGQQRLIRMKVQSDQDVNDPAVMAAILEKIKEKLKNHGLEKDVSVTWREQPDGHVFKNIN